MNDADLRKLQQAIATHHLAAYHALRDIDDQISALCFKLGIPRQVQLIGERVGDKDVAKELSIVLRQREESK